MEYERRISKIEEQIKTLFSADKNMCCWLKRNEDDIKAMQKNLHVQTEMLVEIRHLREEQDELKDIINTKVIDLPHDNYNAIKNYIATAIVGGVIGYLINLVLK